LLDSDGVHAQYKLGVKDSGHVGNPISSLELRVGAVLGAMERVVGLAVNLLDRCLLPEVGASFVYGDAEILSGL
jgi:predicted nucleotidyltransferase